MKPSLCILYTLSECWYPIRTQIKNNEDSFCWGIKTTSVLTTVSRKPCLIVHDCMEYISIGFCICLTLSTSHSSDCLFHSPHLHYKAIKDKSHLSSNLPSVCKVGALSVSVGHCIKRNEFKSRRSLLQVCHCISEAALDNSQASFYPRSCIFDWESFGARF